jgi:hypothetical protein
MPSGVISSQNSTADTKAERFLMEAVDYNKWVIKTHLDTYIRWDGTKLVADRTVRDDSTIFDVLPAGSKG